jgi:hypothetical protein
MARFTIKRRYPLEWKVTCIQCHDYGAHRWQTVYKHLVKAHGEPIIKAREIADKGIISR